MTTRTTHVAWLGLFSLCLTVAAVGCGGDESDDKDNAKADAGKAGVGEQPELPKGSWGMLGHDLGSTYFNSDETKISTKTVSKLKEVWTMQTSGGVTGAPCIIGKYAYVLAPGRLYKLDAATGDKVWDSREAPGTSAPACTEDTIYIHNSKSELVALSAKTGKKIWLKKTNDHMLAAGFSSPIVAGDLVIVGTSSTEETSIVGPASFHGTVVAYDRITGKKVWTFKTVDGEAETGAAVWSTVSVSLEDSMVFVGTGNNYTGDPNELSDSIIALDIETGKKIWSRQLTEGDVFTSKMPNGNPDDDFGANPIVFEAKVDGKTQKLVGAGQKSGMFWVLDRMTGKVVWSQDISGGSALSGGMLNNGAFDGEYLIAAGNNGTSDGEGSEESNGESGSGKTSRLVAMEAGTGKIVWERQLAAFVWAPITIANGVGFVSVNKELQAFDTKTGKRLYTLETKGSIACAASISDGRVIFGSGFSYVPGIITPDTTLHALALP